MTSSPHENTRPPEGVRSTRRRGRVSPAKLATLRELGPRWMLAAEGPWSPDAVARAFERPAPLLVDIGVGNGAATLAWSRARPEANVLAIEVHRPGIVTLLRSLDAERSAPHVRIVETDALAVLEGLGPSTVHAIRVLFPDPWPKRRHIARRLVDRSFVQRAHRVLEPGGELHLATDDAGYAAHMRSMLATEPTLRPRPATDAVPRPITTYEQRGLDAGRVVTDLVYRKGLVPGA